MRNRESARRSGLWSRRLLIGGILAWFSFLVLFPTGGIVKEALTEGIGPFFKALNHPETFHAFFLTGIITVISVGVNSIMGVILSLVLARQHFRGKILLDGLVDLPLAVSPVVAGFMFIVLFGPEGWLGQWFERGGIKIVFAVPGMILATLFVTLPFVVREVVPVLRELGIEQEDAARTLGANEWQTFWQITFPSMRWGLMYGITLTAARALGEFGAVLVVSGAIIGKTVTATLLVHEQFTDFHYLGAFAASLVLAVLSFILLLVMEFVKHHSKSERIRKLEKAF